MSTNILVLATESTSAAGLEAAIQVFDPAVNSVARVLQGCITVGLNRMLSAYTFPTTAALSAAVPLTHVPATDVVAVTPLADDATRIAALVTTLSALSLTTADVTGAAARTGLAMLLGSDTPKAMPPLRTP